jgi:hypothetical protein
VQVTIDQLQRNGYGVHGEVTIETTDGGHLAWERIRVSDGEDRARLARRLTERTRSGSGSPINWTDAIEAACTLAVREWRKGEPVVDLASVEPPSGGRPYLLERLLPLGETSLLYADGGQGKSLVALALGCAIRSGTALPAGLRPVQQTEVLYLDWETNAVTHARRLRALAAGLGIALPPLHYLRMDQPLVLSQARIAAEVDHLKAGLVIVDSAGFAARGDLNDAATATELFNALRALGVTALIVHHVNKAAAERDEGSSKPFGAAYFWNGARNAWELRSMALGTDRLRISLWHRKDNDGGRLAKPLGLELSFESDAVRFNAFDVGEDGGLAAFGGPAFLLRLALRDGCRPISTLEEATGLPAEVVKKTLTRNAMFVRVIPGGGKGRETQWGLAQ